MEAERHRSGDARIRISEVGGAYVDLVWIRGTDLVFGVATPGLQSHATGKKGGENISRDIGRLTRSVLLTADLVIAGDVGDSCTILAPVVAGT